MFKDFTRLLASFLGVTRFLEVDYDCFLSTQIRAVTAIGVGNFSMPITINVNEQGWLVIDSFHWRAWHHH